jgi:hypothetical protein
MKRLITILFLILSFPIISAQDIDERFQRKVFIFLYEFHKMKLNGPENEEKAKIKLFNQLTNLWRSYGLTTELPYDTIEKLIDQSPNDLNQSDEQEVTMIKGFIRIKRDVDGTEKCYEYLNGVWNKELPLEQC